MKQTFKLLHLIFTGFFINCNLYAQKADNYADKIDSLILLKSPRSFNGVILITKNGKTEYSKAFGYADFENKVPLTLKDNFRIQSNSKQVTAVLVLKEVEKRNIDLKSPVRKYLPEIQQTWADTVTIHQLLNFSSGITAINKPLLFKPGTAFLYNVISYTMLGDIIEKVTGKKYAELANNLFKELKMNNSFCDEYGKNKNRIVKGYTSTKDSFRLTEVTMNEKARADFAPAGGIISNAEDLNRWDTKLHKGKILKSKSYKLMTSYDITASHEVFGNEKIGYGYGIRIGDKTPVKYAGHAGKGLGFVSLKVYFPEKDVNLIVLENQYSENSTLHYYFEIKLREIIMNSDLVK